MCHCFAFTRLLGCSALCSILLRMVNPKHCIRCDFQPGMFVFWTRADDDIPQGHMGEVLPELKDDGRVKAPCSSSHFLWEHLPPRFNGFVQFFLVFIKFLLVQLFVLLFCLDFCWFLINFCCSLIRTCLFLVNVCWFLLVANASAPTSGEIPQRHVELQAGTDGSCAPSTPLFGAMET